MVLGSQQIDLVKLPISYSSETGQQDLGKSWGEAASEEGSGRLGICATQEYPEVRVRSPFGWGIGTQQ